MGDLDSGGDTEGVCNTLRFRCLFFTRSAVALVVTVLAAVVVVKAVGLILHPKKLQLTVAPSNVYVQRYTTSTGHSDYLFRFYLEAKNPSERVFIYYSNITVGLFKERDHIASFNLTPSSTSLSQQEVQEHVVYGSAHDEEHVNRSLLDDKLFKNEPATTGQKIDGAVMTLDGIIRENEEGIINTDRHATYDCGSVAVINTRELPQPTSDTHKWKCGLAIL
jgi:hypothetical protein